jgi:hypothetical protein
MDSGKKYPPWVDASAPPQLWLDLLVKFPWLRGRPYLVDVRRLNELKEGLIEIGFIVTDAFVSDEIEDAEESLRFGLVQALGFDEGGAASWAALNDRLWRSMAGDQPAQAIVVHGFENRAWGDLGGFVRAVYNALSLTDGIGIIDPKATRQFEYLFVGNWGDPRTVSYP